MREKAADVGAGSLNEVAPHPHVFLGSGHAAAERKTWAVIWLCAAMMVLEIVGGLFFGSLALVADGLHMSTHAGALLLAALAYSYASRHVDDERFSFGTGKLGDLAGFASAIVLAMISVLIGYEAVARVFAPVPIQFREAIPIAVLGLVVNVACAWLLGGDHDHGHDHAGGHDHSHSHEDEHAHGHAQTKRQGQAQEHPTVVSRDNNMRAAVVHVVADAAVSVLVIAGLLLARAFGWLWMDPVAGLIGAVVIASWSWRLLQDTGRILLDMNPDPALAERIRHAIEGQGDRVDDLHLWRLGPGHLGAIVSLTTDSQLEPQDYHARLEPLGLLSHMTVQVCHRPPSHTAADASAPGMNVTL